MKILVTGATGFIGQHVVPELLNRKHNVMAVARNDVKIRNFEWHSKVNFINCDIHDIDEKLVQLFSQQDAIIHLAWPGLPNYKDLFHFEHNLNADYQFIKSLIDNGMKQCLITGTCFEYGMQNGSLSESTQTNPMNPYALAKDTLRKFLQLLQKNKPNGFILQWVRLFYMYGHGQNENSLLSQLDRAIDNGEKSFDMSGGEQLRDYLPVEEVARRIVNLLENPEFDGIANICHGEPISIKKLVEQHVEKRRVKIQLNMGVYPYPDFEAMAFWGQSEIFKKNGELINDTKKTLI